jgi:membrane-associated phospholipid phosphatase
MEKEKFAEIISDVFNPLFVSSVVFILLITMDNSLSGDRKILLTGISVVFASLIPIGYLLNLKRRGKIREMEIIERHRRYIPFLLGLFNYFIGFLILLALGAPRLVSGVMLFHATNTLFVLFVTLRWKISAHAVGISGPLMVLSFRFGSCVLPFYILVPLIGASRVVLKRHTVAQVIVGMLAGLGLTALQLRFLIGR